jgi:hypothetical protein
MEARSRFDERELTKRDAALLEGLRAALSAEEHRLYRSGKLVGLFASKTGPVGEAATLALREKLLEHSRTEVRGRFEIEWVRLTAQGVNYLYDHDSPRAVLADMRQMLQTARGGIPIWQNEMLSNLEKLGSHITDQMGRYLDRLDALTKRVDEALRRAEITPELASSLLAIVPWGLDALTYLDRRKEGGALGECPLPELFGALRAKHPTLTIRDYHAGLRRLFDNRTIRLLPAGNPNSLPQPEYALMMSGQLMYLVGR